MRISEWADETKFEEVRWKRPDVPEVLQDDPEEEGTRPDMEKWGYVDVRPGVHMLYWLYYSTHPDGYRQRPWILWLQVLRHNGIIRYGHGWIILLGLYYT